MFSKKKFQAFTLMELLIVIGIMGLLATLFMSSNSRQIQILDANYKFSQILEDYQKVFSKNLSSPYLSGKKYQYLDLKFFSGKNYFEEFVDGKLVQKKFFDAEVVGISGNGRNLDFVGIRFFPYKFDCKFFLSQPKSADFVVSKGDLENFFTGNLEIYFSFPKLGEKKVLKINSDFCGK